MFCQAKEDLGDVSVGGDEARHIGQDDIFVVTYQAAQTYVIDGRVILL